jgi:hypothetical protein
VELDAVVASVEPAPEVPFVDPVVPDSSPLEEVVVVVLESEEPAATAGGCVECAEAAADRPPPGWALPFPNVRTSVGTPVATTKPATTSVALRRATAPTFTFPPRRAVRQ